MTTSAPGLTPLTKLLPVTGSFAAPLIGLSSLLSFNVVQTRLAVNTWEGESTIGGDGKKVKQPDGNEYDLLLIATRVHANAVENIPVTLVLAALAELNGADRRKLTAVLATFSVMRVLHVVGLTKGVQLARGSGEFEGIHCFCKEARLIAGCRVLWQSVHPAWPGGLGCLSGEGLLGLLDVKGRIPERNGTQDSVRDARRPELIGCDLEVALTVDAPMYLMVRYLLVRCNSDCANCESSSEQCGLRVEAQSCSRVANQSQLREFLFPRG